jgi:nitrogenase iron protein NifH
VRLGGIICNSRKADNELELVKTFAEELRTQLIHFVPGDNIVQRAKINKKTVIDFDSSANQADEYRKLAKAIDENKLFVIPKPMEQERLEELMMKHGILDAV